jgi:hypothetical protein
MNKKSIKIKWAHLYNEYEFGGQKLLNMKDLSLKASGIQKL